MAVVRAGQPPTSDIELSLQAGQQAIAACPGHDRGADDEHRRAAAVRTSAVPRSRTCSTGRVGRERPGHVALGIVDDVVPRAATTAPATTVPATTAAPTTPPTTAPPTTPAPRPVGPIVALGDSVMLGAAPQLLATFGPGTLVDAEVGRTLWPVVGIVAALRAQGRLGEQVVIHLGDNGGVDPGLIAQTMASLADVERVVWLTVKVPRRGRPG